MEPDLDLPLLPETPDEEKVVARAVTLPITVPDLSHLTLTELAAIRGYIATQTREARKASNKVLGGKQGALRALWMKTLGMRADVAAAEREEIIGAFEAELLRAPEAFVKYAVANSLFRIDGAIKDEMLRRSRLQPVPTKKTR